jgi:hypothetical protein
MAPEPTGRCLRVYVYRSSLGDCTNGGVTATAEQLVVAGSAEVPMEGYLDLIPDIVLTHNALGNVIAVPAYAPADAGVGPMDGGNYVSTSDSRWSRAVGIYGAIPVHDRYEHV